MQAIVLLLLRFSTGSYLTIWGLLKLMSPETALKVSDKYYSGMLNADIINYGLGAVQVALGVLVILGLFRKLVYPAQALVYFAGLVAIAPYILDPFGLYLVESAKVTFYPSTTLFFAALVMIVFKSHDSLSMDTKRRKEWLKTKTQKSAVTICNHFYSHQAQAQAHFLDVYVRLESNHQDDELLKNMG